MSNKLKHELEAEGRRATRLDLTVNWAKKIIKFRRLKADRVIRKNSENYTQTVNETESEGYYNYRSVNDIESEIKGTSLGGVVR